MRNTHFLISTFKRIEEHIRSQEIEQATQKARILLDMNSKNIYARTIELWLHEVSSTAHKNHSISFPYEDHIRQIQNTLIQLCRTAIAILKDDTLSKDYLTSAPMDY